LFRREDPRVAKRRIKPGGRGDLGLTGDVNKREENNSWGGSQSKQGKCDRQGATKMKSLATATLARIQAKKG